MLLETNVIMVVKITLEFSMPTNAHLQDIVMLEHQFEIKTRLAKSKTFLHNPVEAQHYQKKIVS